MPTLNDVIFEKNLYPYLNVTLLGVDITGDLLSEDNQGVEGVELTLDYPQLNDFKASNVILTLSNADGRFSPDNPTNFFITNGDPNIANKLKADGFGSEVTIDIGKIVNNAIISRRVFTGTVVDLDVRVDTAQVKLTCVDGSQALRKNVLQNFGIDRWLVADQYESRHEWGTYRVPSFMTPLSEESVSVRVGAVELTNVEQIRTEGRIRQDAYDIRYNLGEIRTEGGRLGILPNIQFREPYRWRFIDSLIRQILTHTNTTAGNIDVPTYATEERLMSTHGRVGWATEWRQQGRTAASAAGWSGYAKDFVFNADGTEAVFVYGGENSQHALLHYNLTTDAWSGLYEPATPIEIWQIATTNFDDFYVLGTDTGQYDALTGSIKIWRYRMSTSTWSVVSEAGSGDPQLASPYHLGTPDTAIHSKFNLYPDTYHMFTANNTDVFFRKANATGMGVRSVANDFNTDFTTPAVDNLNYAYDGFITDDYLYLAYITGTTNQHLRVIRQDIDNPTATTTEVVNIPLSVNYFSFGVSQCVPNGDDGFWCVVQRGLPEQGFGSPIPGTLGDGSLYPGIGQLCYVDFSADTRTVLYTNNYTTGAANGVRLEAGKALYFLGSIYIHDSPFNFDGRPDEQDLGHLLEVTTSEAVITQRSWTSFIGNATHYLDRCISPLRQSGESTFFIAGFDNPNDALGYDVNEPAAAQSIENWQLLELADTVPLKLQRMDTHNRKAWDVLTELATLTHRAIGFESNRFVMRKRDASRTRTTQDLTTGQTTLQVSDTSDFPATGHILIRQEVIAYSAKTDTTFTLSERGVHDSDMFNHTANSEVILVDGFAFDHPVDANIMSINLEPDFLNLYNQITVRYGDDNRAYVENADSVEAFGERQYELVLNSLSEHQRDWATWLAQSYLDETSEIRSLLSMRLRWSPELDIGDIIVVHYEDNVYLNWVPCRILRVYHDVTNYTTQITAKEIPRYDLSAPVIGEILLPRLRVGDYFSYRFTASGVPDATFSLTNVPDGLTLDADTGDITGTPITTGESSETLTATNSEGSDSVFVVFDVRPESSALTLTFTGVTLPTVTPIPQNCYVDIEFPAAIGGREPVLYSLDGIPTTMKFDGTTRRLTGISSTVGDTAIYYNATDSSTPEQTAIFSTSLDLDTETQGVWSAMLITPTKINMVDNAVNEARQYDLTTGLREVENFADISLSVGVDWTGAVATTDRKIFVDNTANRAVFYDLMNTEQTTEQIDLGAGDWQGVGVIGNRLGFLDRATSAVRMYTTARVRDASADITFGFVASFADVASNDTGTKVYVLIENLDVLLVWDVTDAEFKYDETIPIIRGTYGWQAVTRHPSGHLMLAHKTSNRIIAIDAGVRNTTLDIDLRYY